MRGDPVCLSVCLPYRLTVTTSAELCSKKNSDRLTLPTGKATFDSGVGNVEYVLSTIVLRTVVVL
jgi:hypothetical protein